MKPCDYSFALRAKDINTPVGYDPTGEKRRARRREMLEAEILQRLEEGARAAEAELKAKNETVKNK